MSYVLCLLTAICNCWNGLVAVLRTELIPVKLLGSTVSMYLRKAFRPEVARDSSIATLAKKLWYHGNRDDPLNVHAQENSWRMSFHHVYSRWPPLWSVSWRCCYTHITGAAPCGLKREVALHKLGAAPLSCRRGVR